MLSRIITRARCSQVYQIRLLETQKNNLVVLDRVRADWSPPQARYSSSTPMNTIIIFVPQQEAWIVERMGKFDRVLSPGLNFLLPFLDRVKYVQCLKEMAIDIPKQSAITADNVNLSIDGVLYLKINDPLKTSYGVEDPEFAVTQLAMTTMRAELGKMTLEQIFQERVSLNVTIVDAINKASESWGLSCLRYEIRDISMPIRIQEAMQMQVEAERKKRAAVLESEGLREAAINVAEGRRQARILASEAEKTEQINRATGEAEALQVVARARAKGLELVAQPLQQVDGKNAASLMIAEQWVQSFAKLAKTNNTLILPSNTGDVSNMVGQAMSIYSTITKNSPLSAHSVSEQPSSVPNLISESTRDDEEYYSDEEEREKHKAKSTSLEKK